MAGISQLDAARRQLDCAIGLLDSEDLAAHTLAWAAFNLLFEILGDDTVRKAMHTVAALHSRWSRNTRKRSRDIRTRLQQI